MPRELWAIIEGYLGRIKRDNEERRRQTYIQIAPHIDQRKLPFEKFCKSFWYLETDEDEQIIDEETIKQKANRDWKNVLQEHNRQISKGRRLKENKN